ncbi:MAG: hydroxymethylbilane synthase [Chloroflexota bacterium]|nr:hydroxymethylbilane synthase [Chloroflexota bacterium]
MIGKMAMVITVPTQGNTRARSLSRLVIGTRGSALAMWQANAVRAALTARFPEMKVELNVIRPEGDIDKTSSLLKIGGRGVFASALQQALLDGEIDVAVHSTKDVPTIEPAGLVIVAFPEREDARDAVVSRHGVPLAKLPDSPVIGTSSRRRAVQVLAIRPDATVIDLRGNIDTRLRKAESSEYDAVILAAAGLARMGWQHRIVEYLPFDRFVPSPGQGALAIETRADPDPAYAVAKALDYPDVSLAVRLEREFLRSMGGGCTTPIGAHVEVVGDAVTLWAMMAADNGSSMRQEMFTLGRATAMSEVPDIASCMMKEIVSNQDVTGRTGADLGSARPLAGKHVLVTGTGRFVESLGNAFRPEGADVLDVPTLDILPSSTPTELKESLEQAAEGRFEWLVVTSQQTVPALTAFGVDRLRGQVRIAAMGTSTAAAIRAAGLPVGLVPEVQTGPGLIEAFHTLDVTGAAALCLLGSTASDTVPAGLQAAGMTVTRMESYQSRPIEGIPDAVREAVRSGHVDLVVFASPLTVQTLSTQLGADLAALSGACLVAMGVTTRRAMEHADLPVHVVAQEPTPEGIVAASRTWFAERSGIEGHRA